MNRRQKGQVFSVSKRKVPSMNKVTIGTHVPGVSTKNAPTPHAFNRAPKAKRGGRGMVDHLTPDTRSGESMNDFSKRVGKPNYSETLLRNARVRRILLIAALAFVIVCIAAGVGVVAYTGSVSNKMGLGDSNARDALVPAQQGEPYYLLFAAEFFDPGKDYNGPSLLMLMRIDEAGKKVTMLSIPANLQVQLSDGNYHRICEAQVMGGDSELVKAVSDLAGVPIAHFVKTNRESFVKLVDALGGVTLDVTQEVDDPQAGPLYIPAGSQALDGEAALVLCRATNFLNGDEQRAQNQCEVMEALLEKLLEKNQVSLVPALDSIANDIYTDYSATDAIGLVNTFRGIDEGSIFTAQMPGYPSTSAST
ncbi:MAG: LCP family protein, partial [Eggerthellaceae bacterium]|nr:LCP family protein [Eggerthellaceae bacterium]